MVCIAVQGLDMPMLSTTGAISLKAKGWNSSYAAMDKTDVSGVQ